MSTQGLFVSCNLSFLWNIDDQFLSNDLNVWYIAQTIIQVKFLPSKICRTWQEFETLSSCLQTSVFPYGNLWKFHLVNVEPVAEIYSANISKLVSLIRENNGEKKN